MLAATLAILSLAAGAPLANASVTIGQLAPPAPPAFCNNATSNDVAQPTVTSGNPYAVPPTITRGTVDFVEHQCGDGEPAELHDEDLPQGRQPGRHTWPSASGPAS